MVLGHPKIAVGVRGKGTSTPPGGKQGGKGIDFRASAVQQAKKEPYPESLLSENLRLDSPGPHTGQAGAPPPSYTPSGPFPFLSSSFSLISLPISPYLFLCPPAFLSAGQELGRHSRGSLRVSVGCSTMEGR